MYQLRVVMKNNCYVLRVTWSCHTKDITGREIFLTLNQIADIFLSFIAPQTALLCVLSLTDYPVSMSKSINTSTPEDNINYFQRFIVFTNYVETRTSVSITKKLLTGTLIYIVYIYKSISVCTAPYFKYFI